MLRRGWMGLAAWVVAIGIFGGCATLDAPARHDAAGEITVLCFNIWEGGGGLDSEQFEQTLAVLHAANADVVGIQESDGLMAVLAQAAGYTYFDQQRQIMSRFPIVERLTPAKGGGGVAIEVPGTGRVVVYNVHFEAYPYGPYELVRDGTMTVAEALANEYTGNEHVPHARAVLNALQSEAVDTPVVWMGDFNVPSHLDWDEASRELNGGFVVPWPVSRELEIHGFVDAYRAVNPDAVERRGLTWTPIAALDDPEEVHDRIDFIYARGNGVEVIDCIVLGEPGPFTDMAFDPYPSDHRAVLARIALPGR